MKLTPKGFSLNHVAQVNQFPARFSLLPVSLLIIVALLSGCGKTNQEAEGRRLAEKWEALTVAHEIKKKGSSNEQWPASVFLSLDVLNRCAGVLKGIHAECLADKPVIKGATVKITNIEIHSEVGQLVAKLEVEAYSANKLIHLKLGADANVRYIGTELDKDKKGLAIFRLDPYSFYGKGGAIIPLFKVGETSDFARLLANMALLHANETELKFSVPVPTDFTIPLGLSTNVTEKLGDSKVTFLVSQPKGAITTPLEFGSFMVCKSGFFLLVDKFKPTLQPVANPSAPATIPDEMKPVYEHLQRIGSALWKTNLPPTQAALEVLLVKSEVDLAEMFAQKPTKPGDIVLHVKGDTLTGLFPQFHTNTASREVTARSTLVEGHLAEKKFGGKVFENAGIFAELKGNDAIFARLNLDAGAASLSAAGMRADLSYKLVVTAKARVQVTIPGSPSLSQDIEFTGTSGSPGVPISLVPVLLAQGDARGAAFEVTISDENITTGLTAKSPPPFPGNWLTLANIELKMHGSLIGEQPAPFIALYNESRLIPPPLKAGKDWKVTLPFGYAVATLSPKYCLATDNGIVVAADFAHVLRTSTATSPEGLAEAAAIKARNSTIKKALDDAGVESAKKRTRKHTRTFEVAFGNALITPNSELGKLLGDAERAGQKVLGQATKPLIPELEKVQKAKKELLGQLDKVTAAEKAIQAKADKLAEDVYNAAKAPAQAVLDLALSTLPPVPPVLKVHLPVVGDVEDPVSKAAHDAAQKIRDAAERAARATFAESIKAPKLIYESALKAHQAVFETAVNAVKLQLDTTQKAEDAALAALKALTEQIEIGSSVTVMP